MGAGLGKVGIVGAGMVGATTAFTLALQQLCREIVLLDVDRKRALGHAMDISHGLPFLAPVRVREGDYQDLGGSDLVVVAAGVPQRPGESRLDLAGRNAAVFADIIPRLDAVLGPEAVVLVLTNPVDVLTWLAGKFGRRPRGRILGSGTLLDTARLRWLLGRHCGVDTRNVHGYVLGEHGDSAVVVWSGVQVGGMLLADACPRCGRGCPPEIRDEITEEVRRAAGRIIEHKGATYYAVAVAACRIAQAVLGDQRSVLTVSCPLEGEYGIRGVSLSLPWVVGREGAMRSIQPALSPQELEKLHRSAEILRAATDKVDAGAG